MYLHKRENELFKKENLPYKDDDGVQGVGKVITGIY